MEEDILYNKDIHNRKSLRLQNYDYSQNGLYFITICTNNQENLFWENKNIENIGYNNYNVGVPLVGTQKQINIDEIIQLNNAGKMINKWINEFPNKYENIKMHEYVIMWDHIHFIIEICNNKIKNLGQTQGVAPTIGNLIGAFKSETTNEYIKMVKKGILSPFNGKIWQRNYYENVIRNEEEYLSKREYIKNNPIKWINENIDKI